ncbi:MAG TPA: DUF3891 family protein [Clostridia bacterium]|nr:DUF3891 family protein [Clostridia bacterium]
MLIRKEAEGITAISQPAHAWVAGQLARNWGNDQFFTMTEEICLAAEQHDIGFLEWERSPTLNANTGLPHTFLDMPRPLHLELWTKGIHQMLQFGRYPALLVSMHFTALAQREKPNGSAYDRKLLKEFLQREGEFQTGLITSLSNDFYYGSMSSEETIRCHQKLVSIFDWISLLLCHRLAEPEDIPGIPTRDGSTTLKLKPLDESGGEVSLTPWPFRSKEVQLVCEGRHLLETFTDEKIMQEALKAAAPVTLIMKLVSE